MNAKTIVVAGAATVANAPSNPTDVVRLSDMQAALEDYSEVGHTQLLASITDFQTAAPALLSGIFALLHHTHLLADITDFAGSAPAILSEFFSPVGHTHLMANITDLVSGLPNLLTSAIGSTNSIQFGLLSGVPSAQVRCKAAGGVLSLGDGLAIDLGTLHTQAAFGDHTHALLHQPLSIAASETLNLTWNPMAQSLALEVQTYAGSGLIANTEGLSVDFGFGANQAARGNQFAMLSGLAHPYATVQSSATIELSIAGQLITANAILDPAPPSGYGLLASGIAGLSVALGTTASTAAAGNHGHSVVSAVNDGFMSKTQLGQFSNLLVLTSGLSLSIAAQLSNLQSSITSLVSGTVASVNGQSGIVNLTTSNIAEGSGLYFTATRTRNVLLSGLYVGTGGAVLSTDNIVQAIGKLENRMAINDAKIGGTTWIYGSVDPASGTGLNSNIYLNVNSGAVFLKTSGAWSQIYSPNGLVITGAGVPSSGTGYNGNVYINTDNGDVYTKAAGTWTGTYTPTTGNSWSFGSGDPTGGADGDFYIDTAAGAFWTRASGSWNNFYTIA